MDAPPLGTAALPQLRDPRLRERLAAAIAREIVSGRLREGTPLPAVEALGINYSVSRTVARETLQALTAAGLVSVQQGKRTVVTPADEWRFVDPVVQQALALERPPDSLLHDLYEARRCLEVELARLAAERADDAAVNEIASLAASIRAVERSVGDPSFLTDLVHFDRAFHTAVADAARNVVLARLATDIRRGLVATWTLEQIGRPQVRQIADHHVAIAEAIAAHDAASASEVMAMHIGWTLEHGTRPAGSSGTAP